MVTSREIMILNEASKENIASIFNIKKKDLQEALTISDKISNPSNREDISTLINYLSNINTSDDINTLYEETGILIAKEIYGEDYKLIMDRFGQYPDDNLDRWPEYKGEYINNSKKEENVDIVIFEEDKEGENIDFI